MREVEQKISNKIGRLPETEKGGKKELQFRVAVTETVTKRITCPKGHGKKATLSPGTFKSILDQMQVTAAEFARFMKCKLTGPGWLKQMQLAAETADVDEAY